MKRKVDYLINGFEKRIIRFLGIIRGRAINLFYRHVKIGRNTYVARGVKFTTLNGGLINIGRNCSISNGVCFITEGGNITIADDCSFNPYVMIYGQGGLFIGNGVRIATHAVIIPSNHVYKNKNKYIYEQGLLSNGIYINDNVWIGANAVILDGVNVAFGSVVAAGAVVSKNTEEFSINGGVPAKQIKIY